MNRHKPEIHIIEWDNDQTYLRDFFTEDCEVEFWENEELIVAFDYDDPSIMTQQKESFETHRMNLLYAREHFRNLWDRYFDR